MKDSKLAPLRGKQVSKSALISSSHAEKSAFVRVELAVVVEGKYDEGGDGDGDDEGQDNQAVDQGKVRSGIR